MEVRRKANSEIKKREGKNPHSTREIMGFTPVITCKKVTCI